MQHIEWNWRGTADTMVIQTSNLRAQLTQLAGIIRSAEQGSLSPSQAFYRSVRASKNLYRHQFQKMAHARMLAGAETEQFRLGGIVYLQSKHLVVAGTGKESSEKTKISYCHEVQGVVQCEIGDQTKDCLQILLGLRSGDPFME